MVLTEADLSRIVQDASEAASRSDREAAWNEVQPLLRAQSNQVDAARALLAVVANGNMPHEQALEILSAVYSAYPDDADFLCLIGDLLDYASDIDMLNRAPPEAPVFSETTHKLTALLEQGPDRRTELRLLTALRTAARMQGRQHDELADRAARRLIELEPERSSHHFNYGLLLKTRGRFREGMKANEAAALLAQQPTEACQWNLGICATGAGEGQIALRVWQEMQNKIRMGRFGLPDGSYPQCKVRLAQFPLAERTASSDDPGLEETIWIERLSPCHGIVRSVLYQDLGVDYGDVVLIDGAPITYHKFGDREVPVFPHLATLVRSQYQFFDFAATQDQADRIADMSVDLERDAVVYSHTESFTTLCSACWRNPDMQHEHGAKESRTVVLGRIAAPADLSPPELLRQLDAAIATRAPCRIYVPQLCAAAGLNDRAALEQRRFDMLTKN